MMKKKKYFILMIFIFLTLGITQVKAINTDQENSNARTINFNVGSSNINLKITNDLHEIAILPPEIRDGIKEGVEMMRASSDTRTRVLEIFVSENYVNEIKNNILSDPTQGMILLATNEKITFSDSEFQRFAREMKAPLTQVDTEKVNAVLQKKFDTLLEEDDSVKIKTNLTNLGIFLNENNAFGYISQERYNVDSELGIEKITIITGTVFIFIRGKILMAIFSCHDSDTAIDWVVSKSKEWVHINSVFSNSSYNNSPYDRPYNAGYNSQNSNIYSSSGDGAAAIFGLIFWGFVIFFIIKKLSSGGEKQPNSTIQTAATAPIQSNQPYLNVRCIKKNEPIPQQPGKTVELIRVSIGGQAFFPHDNATVTYRVRLIDVTDGDHNAQPMLCYLSELSDEAGGFTFDVTAEVPYSAVTFDDIELVNIPTETLVAPKKGQRRIKVLVGITPPGSIDRFYIDGETTINFIQHTYGWMEFQEAVADQESKLAILALSFASVGGIIGKAEASTIKRYFSELYANSKNVDSRKQKVNETMKGTLDVLKNKQKKPRDLIHQVCDELFRENSAPLSQQAYELCVRVSVADEKLESLEEEILSYIAGKLQLPNDFVAEIHDRYISISSRQHNSAMSIFDVLGMPKGLTKEQKHDWIQTQYRKWKSRVTNKDPKVAAEASLMLGMLSKAKTQLSSET